MQRLTEEFWQAHNSINYLEGKKPIKRSRKLNEATNKSFKIIIPNESYNFTIEDIRKSVVEAAEHTGVLSQISNVIWWPAYDKYNNEEIKINFINGQNVYAKHKSYYFVDDIEEAIEEFLDDL